MPPPLEPNANEPCPLASGLEYLLPAEPPVKPLPIATPPIPVLVFPVKPDPLLKFEPITTDCAPAAIISFPTAVDWEPLARTVAPIAIASALEAQAEGLSGPLLPIAKPLFVLALALQLLLALPEPAIYPAWAKFAVKTVKIARDRIL